MRPERTRKLPLLGLLALLPVAAFLAAESMLVVTLALVNVALVVWVLWLSFRPAEREHSRGSSHDEPAGG